MPWSIGYKKKRQPTLSKSEAEYKAISSVASEVVLLQRVLSHFEVHVPYILLFYDNLSSIRLASNSSWGI